jgi:hypothetical protein
MQIAEVLVRNGAGINRPAKDKTMKPIDKPERADRNLVQRFSALGTFRWPKATLSLRLVKGENIFDVRLLSVDVFSVTVLVCLCALRLYRWMDLSGICMAIAGTILIFNADIIS